MPRNPDRFLKHRSSIPRRGAALGRVFSVTRETWRLSDDPQAVRPQTELVASRRTASDSADIARQAAEAFPRHGFHKPSASWWGADDEHFNRFVVHGGVRHATTALVVGAGLAGLAAVALFNRSRRSKVEN
jgi:hypothetical protein